MTPEDEFPPANDKLKGILRSKAPWEAGDDENQEPHVVEMTHDVETVSRDAYDRVLRELFSVADELTALRAERDRLAAEIERRDQAWLAETKTNEQVVEQATGQHVPLAIPKHMVSDDQVNRIMDDCEGETRAALNQGEPND